MIVVLMGYMGSGKSTIGQNLATTLNYNFLDLDSYISKRENATITSIFNTKGEIYFRKKEALYLREILNSETDLVLALGGGTPCYANNINVLLENDNVRVFYLKLSIPLLAERLIKEKAHRPLISHLQTKDQFIEFIGKHLFERAPYYNQASFVINTDYKTQKDITETIVMTLI